MHCAPTASLRPACDWWSLGISIVELATGWHPMRRPDGSWPTIPELSRMLSAPIDLSGIGDLAAFQQLSYSHVQAALDQLLRILGEVESNFALLNTELPAIGKSVSDLLELVDGVARGVANAHDVLSAAAAAPTPRSR